MGEPWMLLAWLVAALGILVILERWFNRHLQGLLLLVTRNPEMVMYISFLVLLPGIALHEFSHWASAILLGVRTKSFSLFPRQKGGRQIHYGSVQIGAADPVRQSLIGLAPLVTGSLAVLLCAWLGLGIVPLSMPRSLKELWGYFQAPNALLWIYLIFAISNAMLPSESDRRPWLPVILFLELALALLLVTNLISKIPTGVTEVVLKGIAYLAYALTLTIAVDLLIAALIAVLEKAISFFSGRRVQY